MLLPTNYKMYMSDVPRLPDQCEVFVADKIVTIRYIHRDPNIMIFEGLLSDNECDNLMFLAAPRLRASEVVDHLNGGTQLHSNRTSDTAYFAKGEVDVLITLERRIAYVTKVPVEHGEPTQILHYSMNAEYQPHFDYFPPSDPGSESHMFNGGQRGATVITYLNNVPNGGETEFPKLNLKVTPKRGDALFFEYIREDGSLDDRTLHAGVPVKSGEKWIATKWMRERPHN